MKKLIWFTFLVTAATLRAQSPASKQVGEGKQVFETSCAVGYCHGLEGRAGHGPRLRDRVWSRSYLDQTIRQGISGSGMPSWEGRLSDEKIAAVISYILTLSQEEPASGQKVEPARTRQAEAHAGLDGKALFFDLMRDRNCGVCHRIDDAGGDVAPGFKGLRGKPLETVLNEIKSQPVSENNVKVTLRDGEEFCGVRVGEDHNSVRAYDLEGTGPPVLRTIDRNALLGITGCPSLNVHADNSRIYNSRELLRIVAWLR